MILPLYNSKPDIREYFRSPWDCYIQVLLYKGLKRNALIINFRVNKEYLWFLPLQVLNVIRRCIIATDLVQFFKNKDEFKSMIENKSQPFSWEEEKCRNVTMSLAMTSCDLTSGNETTAQAVTVMFRNTIQERLTNTSF